MRRLPGHIVVLPGLVLFLAGCALFRPADPPDLTSDLVGVDDRASAKIIDRGRWWETFGDPALNAFVAQVLADNPSVLEAWARLRQVEAEAAKTAAARWLTLDLEASGSVTEKDTGDNSGAGPGPLMPGAGSTSEYYSLGLTSSYEIDLWGRVRSLDRSARLAAEASEYDRQAAMLSLSAAAVETWYSLVAQREQITLLEAQLESNRTTLDLIEFRFSRSLATALDVFQQRQAVARVEAQVPLARARATVLEHQLALLLGRPPGAAFDGPATGAPLPELADVPVAGLPADLLLARPDIRAGWARLESAGWGLSSARADRMPALRITARGEYGADSLADVFDNWFINLAGNLTAPIIDGGRRRAEVARSRALVDEQMAAYRQTVLTACQEVEDALARERYQVEHLASLDRQLDAAHQTHREAIERYRYGLIDYLPALTALATAQDLENSVIEQRLQYLLIRVGLHRALGGSWMGKMTPPEEPTPRLATRSDP
jgi:multidrug efflux system outer membrane protein